ncbi:Uma2 family endonuclease [Spirulina subsalsa]|uniref:Uma2 family endonuclease n=1 Tax=Spirulina subsalsa TaxID=54311 RepID=UPI0002E834D2|nr:Uma2 family endonuclease [Spirulina subsalsa]
MQLLTKKFTIEQYQKMGEMGIFAPEERVELIKGEIIAMSAIGLQHAVVTNRLTNFFPRQLGDRMIMTVQNPIRLNNSSEPQPDLALLKPRTDFYAQKFPTPDDVLLLIEVADSSLTYDQEIKMPLYAENGIPEFWLVNLNLQVLTVYREPDGKTYQQQQNMGDNQRIAPLAFPDLIIDFSTIFG